MVLLDANGATVATTTTDANGAYLFSDLLPGNYQVKFTAPSGTVFTSLNSGDATKDSDAGTGGLTATVTLAAGQSRTDMNAGVVGLGRSWATGFGWTRTATASRTAASRASWASA